MLNKPLFILLICCLAHVQSVLAEQLDIEYSPVSIFAVQEYSTIYDGQLDDGALPFERAWVDHTGAFINQGASIGNNFDANIGFGGIFQFPLPERQSNDGVVIATYPSLRTKFFFIGPSGHLQYKFGDVEAPAFTLKGGMFGYKYNPDAHNLGEYLFRTEAYPNLISSGGLLVANQGGAWVRGLLGTAKFGDFNLDLLALSEMSMPPLYNISLGAVGNYSIGGGILEVGAGVNFKRLIPVFNDNSKTKETPQNAYVSVNGTYESTNVDRYGQPLEYYERHAKALRDSGDIVGADAMDLVVLEYDTKNQLVKEVNDVIEEYQNALAPDAGATDMAVFDSTMNANVADIDAALPTATGNAVDSLNDLRYVYSTIRDYENYYSATGIILMGRAAVNIGKLIDQSWVGPNGLKLFAETALLGVQDYPVFYDDKSQRMPIMFGINLPTFGFFGSLTVQAEYWKSDHLNNLNNKGADANIPGFAKGSHDFYSETEYEDITQEDDLKWSFLASKKVAIFNFTLQVARDHLRVVHDRYAFGPGLESGVVTPKASSWYWSLQIGMGI